MSRKPLNTRQAAAYLGVSKSLLEKLRVGLIPGQSPPFYRVGKSVRYRAEDLDVWAGSNPTAAEQRDENDYKMWRVCMKEGGDETLIADHILFVPPHICFIHGGRPAAIRQIEKVDSIRQWIP